MCESVSSLPTCRLFRDVTWTVTSFADNRTMQTVHCTCPKESVAYIFKREAFVNDDGNGYKYHFACSPESVSVFFIKYFIFYPYFHLKYFHVK